MKSKWLAACSVVALVAAAAFAGAVNYQLLKKVPVPGAGGWDYLSVDDAARRIYISHATQVEVLDADFFTLVGTILTHLVSTASPSPPKQAAVTSLQENQTRLCRLN